MLYNGGYVILTYERGKRMKVVITGASGFIGRHLTQYYLDKKATVICISRQKQRSDNAMLRHMTWNELEKNVKPLEGADAIINLAGESINQRWTSAAKERILRSRLESVERVASVLEQLPFKPVLINASAIGIYGTSLTETFSEESELNASDFLGSVVDQWEAAAEAIPDTRVVLLRFGVVLGTDGGAFPKMSKPFQLGFGGRIGSGAQMMSWIHIDDLIRLIDHCVDHDELEGAVNATAPQPVSNNEFSQQLAKTLGKPLRFPVPAFALKLIFGEMSTLLLDGQRVLPQVAIQSGFAYRYPVIGLALKQLVGGGAGR